ncbi:MAG: RagB/SusD family nutrient uptake outer membrane protein [Chitinophagaceae bacterium BSSC1]|nr:MAG: RagB/SusD family nutrient uptake outer membrane protein [Chitinophagaceae bacterium BSSC1]
MKNNIFKYFLSAIALVIVFTACEKKLEEYNPSGLTASTVYTKAVGFETLVNAAYSYSRYWYGKEEGYQLSEMGTDIWTSGTGDVYPQVSQYNNLQGNNTNALDLEWNSFYAAINLCNTGITNIAAVTDYTAAQKATREGELRFLRAFYNWHIVETWGGVQLTTKPSDGVITTANRTSVDSFYTQIFADLQFAVANLPLTTAEYGRATQPVAKAFLARMYLTRGQNAAAIALANDVIKNYGYSLLPAYSDLWDMGKLKNKEVVWAVDYSTNLALNDLASSTFPSGHSRGSNNGHLMFLMVYDQVNTSILIRDIPNGRPFNRYMPTLSFLNLFDDANDGRYAASFQTVWTANKAATGFAVGDTAAFASKAIIPPAVMASKKYTTYDQAKTYAANGVPVQRKFYVSLKKFKDSTRASLSEAQSARDAYVIRLAEMYLIAAEAEVNIGKTDSAAYYVNIIRTRAALPGKTAQMQVTPAQMNLDFILDERARELAGEQLRWFDLKRTGKLIDRIKTMNPDAAIYVQPFHSVRPIPQSQIDAVTNKSAFPQNQGYQ